MELDQFMKELTVDFLQEIMEVFFPDLARQLNFSKIKDLNKELYTDSPKGTERFVDVLLEVQFQNPPPEVLLIHFESQQQKGFDFSARMLGYQCLIYVREIEGERRDSFSLSDFVAWQQRKRILSFTFCHYSLQESITQQPYEIGLTQTGLRCYYTGISLPMLPAQEYLQKDKSVMCALLVFMNPVRFSPPDLKVACYRKLIPNLPHLASRQINLIVYAIETYLDLTEAEKQVYQQLITEVYPEVTDMISNPLIEQGRQEGIQQGLSQGRQEGIQQGLTQGLSQGRQEGLSQGRQEGITQGHQQAILSILSHRFPQLPAEIRSRILALNDAEKLERLLAAALEVESPDELTNNGFFGG